MTTMMLSSLFTARSSSSATVSAAAVASISSRRTSAIRRCYPERGCHKRRISSWMVTRTTATITTTMATAVASNNPVAKWMVPPVIFSTSSFSDSVPRHFLNQNRFFSVIHQYTDDEGGERDGENDDTTNKEHAGINKVDDDKDVESNGIGEPQQQQQNELQETSEGSHSDETYPPQKSPQHHDQRQQQQQQHSQKQPYPFPYGYQRQIKNKNATKYDSSRYQLIDKWLPVRKHLRRITGIEHNRNQNRQRRYEQRQQQHQQQQQHHQRQEEQQMYHHMSPLFRIPVPMTSWIRITGVFPTTTLDEVVHSVETQLRHEAFLDGGENNNDRTSDTSGGIVDLDAYWNPVFVIKKGGPHCKNSLPNILDRPNLKTEDDVHELFNVKSAHVILSPFGRPMGWDVELSNRSMVYALLLKSRQAKMIGDIRKKEIQKQKRQRMPMSSYYKSNNNNNNNFGSSSTIDGEASSPKIGNYSTTITAEEPKISWTIQDAVKEHLQVWMKSSHHQSPQNDKEEEDDNYNNDDEKEDMDMGVLSTSRDDNEETIKTSPDDDADDHRSDESSDEDEVLGATNEEINDDKVLEARTEEIKEVGIVDGNDDIANESIRKDYLTPLDYVAMGDRQVRIGWKLVQVEEIRPPDLGRHRGGAGGNRRRNGGYAEADVNQSGIIYNVDRFGNKGIPIVVDDSMVRFENCPRGMNMQQLRLLLSRYDLAEQPASDGNTIVSWHQKTDDGKSHRMFIARFADASWARAAIRELQGTIIGGKVLRLVQFPKQIRYKSGQKEANGGVGLTAS